MLYYLFTAANESEFDNTCVSGELVPESFNYPLEPDPELETRNEQPIDPSISDDWRTPPSAKRTAALFLLTVQEKYRLSQKAIDFAVGSISTIVDSVCNSIKNSIKSTLEVETVNSCFDYEDPFSSLLTDYHQSKFYREEFGLIVCSLVSYVGSYFALTDYKQEPVTVELGTSYQYTRSGAKRLLVEKKESFQYIPLIENLEWLLQCRDVYNEVAINS